jgi:hypothetical protein
MRAFHVLAYESILEGTTTTFSDPRLNDVLGSAEQLRLFAVTTDVGGSSPTLTVRIEEGDDERWSNKAGTAEINAAALSTTAVTIARGSDTGGTPTAGKARLSIVLGGTTPRAFLRLWVTGRIVHPG